MPAVDFIQYGTHTINAGTTYTNITTLATVSNRALFRCECMTNTSINNIQDYAVVVRRIDQYTIRLERKGNGGVITVNWQITQFTTDSNITVQRGQVQSNGLGANTDVTITSIDQSKSLICVTAMTQGATDLNQYFATYDFTSNTNLRFTLGTTYGFTWWEWQVIEFEDVDVYRYSGSSSATVTNITLSPTVVPSRTWTLVSQRSSSSLNADDINIGYLTSSSNFKLDSYTATSVNYNVQIAESKGMYVQRGGDEGTGASFNITWINEVSWADSITSLGGQYEHYCTYEGGGLDAKYYLFRADKTTGFAAVVYRGDQSSPNNAQMEWEIVQFIGNGGPTSRRRRLWLIT